MKMLFVLLGLPLLLTPITQGEAPTKIESMFKKPAVESAERPQVAVRATLTPSPELSKVEKVKTRIEKRRDKKEKREKKRKDKRPTTIPTPKPTITPQPTPTATPVPEPAIVPCFTVDVVSREDITFDARCSKGIDHAYFYASDRLVSTSKDGVGTLRNSANVPKFASTPLTPPITKFSMLYWVRNEDGSVERHVYNKEVSVAHLFPDWDGVVRSFPPCELTGNGCLQSHE